MKFLHRASLAAGGAAGSVALLLACCPGPAVASPDDSLDRLFPEVTSSKNLPGDSVASGVVTDKLGRAAAGTVVTLEAWPSGTEVSHIPIGGPIPVSVVAKTTADASGHFELKVDSAKVLDQYKSGDDVELEVVAHGKARDYSTAFTASVPSGSSLPVVAPREVRIAARVDSPEPIKDLIAEQDALKSKVCTYVKVADWPSQKTTVGRAFSTTSKVRTEFSFMAGYKSVLGTAANVGTSTVKFEASGTATVENVADLEYNDVTGAHATEYQKYATYYKAQLSCMPIVSHGIPAPTLVNDFRVRPSQLTGAMSTRLGSSVSPPSKNCTPMQKSFTLSRTSATEYVAGVKISSKIGINLSSQSGYSSGIKVKFVRVSGTSFTLCGIHALPDSNSQDPGYLVAKP
jgi:hypothetical protein